MRAMGKEFYGYRIVRRRCDDPKVLEEMMKGLKKTKETYRSNSYENLWRFTGAIEPENVLQ